MPKFKKKPVVIEAVRYDGSRESYIDAARFIGIQCDPQRRLELVILTLEGEMRVSTGDWIIKGVKGEFYPCKPDIFAATYEPVEEVINASKG